MKKKVVTVTMTQEFYDKLRDLCEMLQIDVSSFLRLRAAEYLRQYELQRDFKQYLENKFDALFTFFEKEFEDDNSAFARFAGKGNRRASKLG